MLPYCTFFLCLFFQQTIILSLIGHKFDDKDMIEGIGIANLYCNCLLFSVAVGIVSGFDSLGSNAFGVKNYRLMGYYFQRGFLVSYIFGGVFFIINYFVAMKLIGIIDFKRYHYSL